MVQTQAGSALGGGGGGGTGSATAPATPGGGGSAGWPASSAGAAEGGAESPFTSAGRRQEETAAVVDELRSSKPWPCRTNRATAPRGLFCPPGRRSGPSRTSKLQERSAAGRAMADSGVASVAVRSREEARASTRWAGATRASRQSKRWSGSQSESSARRVADSWQLATCSSTDGPGVPGSAGCGHRQFASTHVDAASLSVCPVGRQNSPPRPPQRDAGSPSRAASGCEDTVELSPDAPPAAASLSFSFCFCFFFFSLRLSFFRSSEVRPNASALPSTAMISSMVLAEATAASLDPGVIPGLTGEDADSGAVEDVPEAMGGGGRGRDCPSSGERPLVTLRALKAASTAFSRTCNTSSVAGDTKMFSGLRSVWMMRHFSCRNMRPLQICLVMRRTVGIGMPW
mmetsp:Transcript_17269/g.50343  ORF Transcript_17269/g.50343 Transcript_17269/m.50343 type:complete len:401 (-) Transcript_17269:840-2042(-)